MPAIVFIRRYWSFASDDFVYSASVDFITRVICLVIMGVPFVILQSLSLCWPDAISKIFFSLILILCGIMMLLDIILSCMSARGGIMETSKRKHVPNVLLVFLVLSFAELGMVCAGIYFASVHLFKCSRAIAVAFITGCGLRIFHILLYYFWLMTHFRPSGHKWVELLNSKAESTAASEAMQREAQLLAAKSAQRSFKQLLMLRPSRCTANRTEDDVHDDQVIDSAAALFSDMFYDVDLVSSDIVAGLLLLRWQTEQWVGSGHRVPLSLIERDSKPCSQLQENKTTVTTQAVSSERATDLAQSDWLSIQRLRRMAVLSISIYGTLFFMLMHRLNPRHVCRLCRYKTYCRSQCFDDSQSSILGKTVDIGCCICASGNCDKAAVLDMSSLTPADFVELSFDNSVYVSPYFVAVDVQTATIIVSVRGTLSFEDALVDLLCDGVRLTEVEEVVEQETGKRPTFIGHRGMVCSARKLFQRLVAHKSIETAKANYPNFNLVVCGHSLGAGIASFLALLLLPMYPEVKGYAMSCPLGVMNLELANFTKPFLVSVTYGFDLFARLNVATIIDFKWRLVDALSASMTPKYRLITRGFLLSCSRAFSLYCSPCCTSCCPKTTVGRDTTLLNSEAQNRLIHPKPEMPFHRVSVNQTAGQAEQMDASTSGDKVPSSVLNERPRRLLEERRSLLRWLTTNYAEDYLITDVSLSSLGNTQVQPTSDSPDPMKSCDLRDGVFGGRVLHLVDVYMENTDVGPGGHRRRVESNTSYSSSGVTSGSSDAFLGAARVDQGRSGRCCRYGRPEEQGTVAVWTTHEQFRTLLVHPNMFNDHVPHHFLAAINRVHDSIEQSPPGRFNSSVPPNEVMRQLTGVTH